MSYLNAVEMTRKLIRHLRNVLEECRKGGGVAHGSGGLKSKIHGSRKLKQAFHESRTIQRVLKLGVLLQD